MVFEITEEAMKKMGNKVNISLETNIPGGGARIHINLQPENDVQSFSDLYDKFELMDGRRVALDNRARKLESGECNATEKRIALQTQIKVLLHRLEMLENSHSDSDTQLQINTRDIKEGFESLKTKEQEVKDIYHKIGMLSDKIDNLRRDLKI